MDNKRLNEAIETIKELCKAQNACVECPMNCNCGTYPADWEEGKEQWLT